MPDTTNSSRPRTAHVLKSDPASFRDLSDGRKRCEIRIDDRNFREGDLLVLQETVHSAEDMLNFGVSIAYTGNSLVTRIKHIQRNYGLPIDVVALSIERPIPIALLSWRAIEQALP